jgi:hypothetical protein
MNVQRRWMKWIFEEVETFDARLPWERGVRDGAWKRRLSSTALRLIARA